MILVTCNGVCLVFARLMLAKGRGRRGHRSGQDLAHLIRQYCRRAIRPGRALQSGLARPGAYWRRHLTTVGSAYRPAQRPAGPLARPRPVANPNMYVLRHYRCAKLLKLSRTYY